MRRYLGCLLAALAVGLVPVAVASGHDGHAHAAHEHGHGNNGHWHGPPHRGLAHGERYRVLVFTAGSQHASTPAGVQALREIGAQNRFTVVHSTDPAVFSAASLDRFRAVVFLDNEGDVLDAAQQAAFEEWIKDGNGTVLVHDAAKAEPGWDFYGQLIGARPTTAAPVQQATVKVADRVHPATRSVPETWKRTDEWLNFDANVRGKLHVVATVDERTFSGGTMGFDHPIAWCRDYQGGRAYYTAGGHTVGSFHEAAFRAHLRGAVAWAAGVADGDCGATVESNYEKVTLNDEPGEPMTLAVLPDGRVLHNARNGDIRLYDPATGLSPIVNTISVYRVGEEGLQSISIPPDFARTKWVYLYYSPPLDTPLDDPATPGVNEANAPATLPPGETDAYWDRWKGYNHLTRAKFDSATGRLDMSTEQELLRVATDRGEGSHAGGNVEFDAAGNLYLSTGDDSRAAGHDGFSPLNTSPGAAPWLDSERSAANTNDLRGKILRIKPDPTQARYAIPKGNLFDERHDRLHQTRPETYLMGVRNPFRFDVDKNGTIGVADHGPEAPLSDPNRGPSGSGRYIVAHKAANYGWPYCVTSTLPYTRFDYATRTSGDKFNCHAPINDSKWNTGKRQLPPVSDPAFWYSYNNSTPCLGEVVVPPYACPLLFPEITRGQGIAPTGGPIYHYHDSPASPSKFPAYYDGTFLFGEWTRDFMREIRLDEHGKLFKINPLLSTFTWDNFMDGEWGPDGTLYTLEYGDGFFSANPDAQLAQWRYAKGQRAPIAVVTATPTSGQAPLNVSFSSEGSRDPDPGDSITFAWDFENDGTIDSTDPNPSHVYTANGVYTARLTVTDSAGRTDVEDATITVGNSAPRIVLDGPPNGGVFDWGDRLAFHVTVSDPEEALDCAAAEVRFILGHDSHGHEVVSTSGCQGILQTAPDGGHADGTNVFGVVNAKISDSGANGQPRLGASAEAVLQPKRKHAEFFSAQSGVKADGWYVAGTNALTGVDDGDWAAYRPYDLENLDSVTFRHNGLAAGRVELRLDAPDGQLVTTASLPVTSQGAWARTTVPLPAVPSGTHTLYLVFRGYVSSDAFFLDWFEFSGRGVAAP